jgi:hypothetical protein
MTEQAHPTQQDALVLDRSWATHAGETAYSFRREIEQLLKEHKGSRRRAINAGVDKLVADQIMTAAEAAEVKQVCELVFKAIKGTVDIAKAAQSVRDTYQKMLADNQSSPVALTVASVANTAFKDADVPKSSHTQLSITMIPEDPVSGAIVGALMGAGAGFAITGGDPVGAVVGAIVGAAVGAAIGACNAPDHGGEPDPA